MIVFTACWENNESFIEICNVCMKHDSNSKPHSLTPATIFAPESRKTKKTLFIGDFILIQNIVQFVTYSCTCVCTREWNNSKHSSTLFKVI